MSVNAVSSTQPVSAFDLTISIEVKVVEVNHDPAPTISPAASAMSRLEALQKSDPASFKAVMAKVADGLRAEAQTATGREAEFLNKLADRFDAAAKAGSLSALDPATTSPSSTSPAAASGAAATTPASSGTASDSSGSGPAAAASTSSASGANGAAASSEVHHRHRRHQHAHSGQGYGSQSSQGWSSHPLLQDVLKLVADALASVGSSSASSSSTTAAPASVASASSPA